MCILAHGDWEWNFSISFVWGWQHTCIPQVQVRWGGIEVLKTPQIVVQRPHRELLEVLAYQTVVEASAALLVLP